MDQMIYPRLKLKSEVFANILDGQRTEFVVDNDEQPGEVLDEAEKRRIEREESRMKKLMGTDKAFQQTSLSDFFFGNGQSSSGTAQTMASTPQEETKESQE